MARSLTQIVPCSTADEFLDNISPRGSYFANYNAPLDWVFRGLDDESYELIPSALRKDRPLQNLTRFNCVSNSAQMRAEAQIISDFFTMADNCGLELPEDSQELREEIKALYDRIESAAKGQNLWPPKRLLSLVGLMQHYGLPTRLLDWSRSSLIAAYFAAKGAVIRPPSNVERRVVVWAFNLGAYRIDKIIEMIHGPFRAITVVTAPSASNPNLRAQQGLFTLYQSPQIDLNAPVDRRSFDELIQETMVTYHKEDSKTDVMFKFTLPVEEAGRLLWLLAKEGINGASLFPDYEGVVKGIKEKSLWTLPWSNKS